MEKLSRQEQVWIAAYAARLSVEGNLDSETCKSAANACLTHFCDTFGESHPEEKAR